MHRPPFGVGTRRQTSSALASFAKRLMLPVSNDTLLRVVRRRTAPRADPLTVVGIDDWAFRRNRRYGTIIPAILSGDGS